MLFYMAVNHFGLDRNISTTLEWIAMKWWYMYPCCQETEHGTFGDLLKFSLTPPVGHIFHVPSEVSQHLLHVLIDVLKLSMEECST